MANNGIWLKSKHMYSYEIDELKVHCPNELSMLPQIEAFSVIAGTSVFIQPWQEILFA